MLSLNSMKISYSSAHSNMQATNIHVRQKLKIFWVVPGMPEANAWLSGEVLKKNKGSGLYTVQLRPYDDGKPVIRLMDLQNKHMRPLSDMRAMSSMVLTTTTLLKQKRTTTLLQVGWLVNPAESGMSYL